MPTPRTSFAAFAVCLFLGLFAVAAAPAAAQQCDFACFGAPCSTSCWYCRADFQDFCPFNYVVWTTCGNFAGGCTAALTPAAPTAPAVPSFFSQPAAPPAAPQPATRRETQQEQPAPPPARRDG
ncbi:MAG TPA: hypothetical protein VGE98_16965 [Thermoanaerobaculia bacterium]